MPASISPTTIGIRSRRSLVAKRGTKAASPVMTRRETKGELSFIRPSSDCADLLLVDGYHIFMKFATMSERA
jgi:hypothetical protein